LQGELTQQHVAGLENKGTSTWVCQDYANLAKVCRMQWCKDIQPWVFVVWESLLIALIALFSPQIMSAGKQICIDDGLISLTVLSCSGNDVVCRVNNTAMLGETKVSSFIHA
jgi:hypothetical protein